MSLFPLPTPFNIAQAGNVPDMSSALLDWLQPMTFVPVTKTVDGFQVIETGTQMTFQGVIQPLSKKELQIRDIGERGWTTWLVHTLTQLSLNVDDVIVYLGKQYRVMAATDLSLYGFYTYELISDFTGAGPVIT